MFIWEEKCELRSGGEEKFRGFLVVVVFAYVYFIGRSFRRSFIVRSLVLRLVSGFFEDVLIFYGVICLK